MRYDRLFVCAALLTRLLAAVPTSLAEEPHDLTRGLAGYWPLTGNARDHSPHERHGAVRGTIAWKQEGPKGGLAAEFNGLDTAIEIPGDAQLISKGDFTIAAWVHLDEAQTDVPGDLLSQYDGERQRGFHLSLKTNAGVTTTQANLRQLQFGIDNGQASEWIDVGRPGNALLAFALTAYDGKLWAGTCEPGQDEAGRVYRYQGEQKWTDCGAPAPCNSVTALCEFDGKLYAGTGKYRLRGSALAESENAHSGGGVFRYDGDGRWIDCGQLPGVEAIGGMVVFGGKLYASSLYQPAGFFRYEGEDRWTTLETPGKRVEALGAYNGYLYATSYDGGHVYRFDGNKWEDCGQLGDAADNTQTYSFAVHRGRLFVGTWRTGRVYRFEDVNRWTDVGRLGQELEVMGMLVHNGRLIAGTLPLAEVYEYDGQQAWRRMAQLDNTPDVMYRRAWTMAEFDGRVFTSTLPSGRVYSYQAGASLMDAHAFPAGWHHVTAIKQSNRLSLFVDGRLIASSTFNPSDYDLSSQAPLTIGFGQNDFFCGRMCEIRLYERALSGDEITSLADRRAK